MAVTPAVRSARRSLTILGVILLALAGVLSIGVFRGEAALTPKLALDFEGGTQILLAPRTDNEASVSQEQVQQAVSIIRQRVDASGVTEAEVTTMGGTNIAVAIPGQPDDETLQRIQASARLDFRPVLAVALNTPAVDPVAEDGTPDDATDDAAADPAVEPDAADDAAPEAETDGSGVDPASGVLPSEAWFPEPRPTEPGTQEWITPQLGEFFANFTCDSEAALNAGESSEDLPMVSCDQFGTMKYVLGPVEMSGDAVEDAVAGQATTQTGAPTGQWAVNITLDDEGTRTFAGISQRLFGAAEPLNQFAFVIDGQVLSAPTMNAQILDGRPQITGAFTQQDAETIADQIKYGALPISFDIQSQEAISPTLGATQLQIGLITGLVGLALVVIYSLFQYRALGLLTVSSLLVAGIITYLLLLFLSWRQGYRLSLPGLVGIIIAIGITADSFIVYFERIRDALRDGFTLDTAVSKGWSRALRTIFASDAINFLAAGILFALSVGGVRHFAFTLGLTTLVDLLVVALFTHPMMTFLARTRFYANGHPASGLDPRQLGAVYRGRAEFRPVIPSTGKAGRKARGSRREAERRQTIAERKAAAASKEG